MTTASQIQDMVSRYASDRIDSAAFHEWFLHTSVDRRFEDAVAEHMSNRIEGLLAEASHAGWSEQDLREELANAIRPLVPR